MTAGRNWAGNLAYSAAEYLEPTTRGELVEAVRGAPMVRALGSRHSFSEVADTPGRLISLSRMDHVIAIDTAARTVTVEGGIRYGELARFLHAGGWALHNLASLPHISVAGACATATHGSGVGNGSLSTSVRGMEIVTADGSVVSPTGDDLLAASVSLGALGIAASVTLAIEPTYEVRQDVYEGLALETALANFDEIVSAGYSVSLFTHWRAPVFESVWIKRRLPASDLGDEFHGARRADGERHPIAHMSPENCTPQLGVPGPWHERLAHFRLEFTPSAGDELQSEYFIDRSNAPAALRALAEIGPSISHLVQVSEVRTIAADRFPMSPFDGRDRIGIHFTWFPDGPAVQATLPRIEAALAPFSAVPHLGKIFTMDPTTLRSRHPRREEFAAVALRFDTEGKFANPFLQTYVL